jgi:hypothetical protein
MGFFRHSSGELHYTTALDSLELGSPLQSITRGGAPDDERLKQPPIGSRPLQRTKLRKSTFPGLPDPGSFPSRRFSRPQGLSPSEAARACSIPLPLLGFCLAGLPLAGGALSGRLSQVPPDASSWCPKASSAGASPVVRNAARANLMAEYGRALSRANLQPRYPLARNQACLWAKTT